MSNRRAATGRDNARSYIFPAAFVGSQSIAPVKLCTLLFVLLLAGCGGNDNAISSTAIGEVPSYPNVADYIPASVDPSPQPGQQDWTGVTGFFSPDDSATIRQWYKDQLTAKGWQVLNDTSNQPRGYLSFTTVNRDKVFELEFFPVNRYSVKTMVVLYYHASAKPIPMPTPTTTP